ncbi:putative oxidoreductase [Gordonia effusa NBRC 100432]|uniref:Putative oxidoreductase n=1 Tax=Gordonia effusa NBRC 100432 TaxID=1077974 RepID=H0R081_9ACTN|nr:SDR family NAD(P)-dependent oxidoreductase [Gordonia effusa]GAB18482.1 putative oxidoreductase [Gordonia effusa NBRC 100432]
MSSADTGTIVLFGGRSEIGVALTARLAAGRRVVLAARRPDELGAERAIVLAAGALEVNTVAFDADDTDTHPALVSELMAEHGPIEAAIVAFGILGDAPRSETDVSHALQIAQTDYVAQVSILTLLANAMREQTLPSTLVVFSSIAGARVRRANYVYGSTKAGLDGFASGLSDALHHTSVRVLLARPGFVVGAMTADLMATGVKPAPMSSTADQVADAVARAYRRGKREVWVPWAIRPTIFVFRLLPRAIWRRLPR